MVENMMAVMRRNQERKDREAADAERSINRKNTGKYSKIPEGAELRGGAKDYVNRKNDDDEGTGTVINLSASDTPTPVKKAVSPTIAKQKPVVVRKPRESDSSKASRQAAYDEWVKSSKNPLTELSSSLKNSAGSEKYPPATPYAPSESDKSKFLDSGNPEDLPATEAMKKGGMTKRPPKPAKKVPPRKFASGGSVSRTSASKRGDGCATKGHTKGKYL
jgi:hypothetical protein